MPGENPQARLPAYSAPNARIRNDGWWLPSTSKVPQLGSPEHLRQVGYDSGMTGPQKAEFLYKRYLQDCLHGYE